jgi:hypothetical protein
MTRAKTMINTENPHIHLRAYLNSVCRQRCAADLVMITNLAEDDNHFFHLLRFFEVGFFFCRPERDPEAGVSLSSYWSPDPLVTERQSGRKAATHMHMPIAHSSGQSRPHFHKLLAKVCGSVSFSSLYRGNSSTETTCSLRLVSIPKSAASCCGSLSSDRSPASRCW